MEVTFHVLATFETGGQRIIRAKIFASEIPAYIENFDHSGDVAKFEFIRNR